MEILEEDTTYMDNCLTAVESISELETSALFYIAGYVQKKTGEALATALSTSDSEFTEMLSRGKLSYPSEELFQFILHCYALFNLLPNSQRRFQCRTYVTKLFVYLPSTLPFTLSGYSIQPICKTFTNCFFKGITNLEDSGDTVSRSIDERKIRKLSH